MYGRVPGSRTTAIERERERGSFRLEEAAEFGSGLAEGPAGRDVVRLVNSKYRFKGKIIVFL